MGDPGPGELLTREERLALKRLTRRGFDFLFDLRHWQAICAIARKRGITPTDVVFSILEKVFVADLGMITAEDDAVDRSLRHIHTQLKRLRLQPRNMRRLLANRAQDILLVAELFPREIRETATGGMSANNLNDFTKETFVTNLRKQLRLPIQTAPTLAERTRPRSEEHKSRETSEKARIEILVKKLKGSRNADDLV